ncbi:epoxyqueuosine reductase QueH [Acetonema longum]|uniref:Epoxyqueuosine reductase QueH n=1 Tax=Acetonema longum DSM 6540 TaxID=1009370 RepID=F7NQ90_9FIRM|nr:epoxyqueuosine reductase QueH [Acetonema longum]EGO61849.1 hypothetical protein ALO_21454 [Acetonema longum DSM 6540]
MNLLLHMCCGPCSIYPVKQIRESGIEVTGFFYNPNIHPYKEFARRLEAAELYAQKVNLSMIIQPEYTLEEYIKQVLDSPGGRCRACYRLRLRRTAEYARENGFSHFSTTLLVSPYQQHEIIRETAETVAAETGVPFYYVDFRTGWKEGVAISREMELYRQPYCGCIFSERDRYYKLVKSN